MSVVCVVDTNGNTMGYAAEDGKGWYSSALWGAYIPFEQSLPSSGSSGSESVGLSAQDDPGVVPSHLTMSLEMSARENVCDSCRGQLKRMTKDLGRGLQWVRRCEKCKMNYDDR